MKPREAKDKLVNIYGNVCFLNGVILVRKNPLTYHHIVPARLGGSVSIDNGALLCRLEHDMFNAIEENNFREAKSLNEGFKEFKRTRDLQLLKQMREFVDKRINDLDYEVKDTGKMLVLRRKAYNGRS